MKNGYLQVTAKRSKLTALLATFAAALRRRHALRVACRRDNGSAIVSEGQRHEGRLGLVLLTGALLRLLLTGM